MKKNTVLYILLLVLIVINGFFLFNYLGRPEHKGPKENNSFIAKALKLNETQILELKKQELNHHNKMRAIGEDMKVLKDELFEKISKPTYNQLTLDSLITSIAKKESLKEKELFMRLRNIYELCNNEQKKQFSIIIKEARRFDPQGPGGHQGPERPQ